MASRNQARLVVDDRQALAIARGDVLLDEPFVFFRRELAPGRRVLLGAFSDPYRIPALPLLFRLEEIGEAIRDGQLTIERDHYGDPERIVLTPQGREALEK